MHYLDHNFEPFEADIPVNYEKCKDKNCYKVVVVAGYDGTPRNE